MGPASVADYQATDLTNEAPMIRGKLLLMHGELDDNVDPSQTRRLAAALTASGRPFDLVTIDGGGHLAARDTAATRLRWDYLVRNLLGLEPPSRPASEQIRYPSQ
jgi:dipeptidyl aminopeptidase/acylaminoacyl peptidase